MQSPDPATRTRILVVDDDPTFRLLARETLEQSGFQVDEAGDGDEALEHFAQARPQLVLLDVSMPRVDGLTTCRALREVADSTDLPIIMITSTDDMDAVDAAYRAGATDFIQKPVRWPILAHRVRYVLRGSGVARDLRHAERRNGALLRAIPEAIFTLDVQGRCREFLKDATDSGLGAAAPVAGRPLEDTLPEDAARTLAECAREAAATGSVRTTGFWIRRAGAEPLHFEARMTLAEQDEVLALVRDTTAQKLHERSIRNLAYYDSLTGLPNRRSFLERLEVQLRASERRGTRLAVVFLDLDGFKAINDSLGHEMGDRLLNAVAERLTREMRETDMVSRPFLAADLPQFARLGGDEFTVLVPDVRDPAAVGVVLERIRSLIAEPFEVEGRELRVTSSLGVALFPDDARDGASLLRFADRAMYRAKSLGKNNWQAHGADSADPHHDLNRAMV